MLRSLEKGPTLESFFAGVDRKYVIATFAIGRTEQVSLDVTFFAGNPLSFSLDGSGEVHLVGSMQYVGGSDQEDSFEDDDDEGVLHNHKAAKKPKPAQKAMLSGLIDDEAEDSEGEEDSQEEDEDEEDEEDGSEEEDELPSKPFGLLKPKEDSKPKQVPPTTPGKKDHKIKTPGTPAGATGKVSVSTPTAPSSKPAATTPAAASGKAAASTPTPASKPQANKPPTTPGATGAKEEKKRPAPATPKAADDDKTAKKAKNAPKSPSNIKCDQCPGKAFPTEHALEQHQVAKHGAAKA